MRVAWLAIALLYAVPAGAEELYRLPWPEGLSFTFTQVADGRITTHITKATLNAVDIAMPVGAPVLAARAGTVEAIETRHGVSADEDPLTYEGNFVRVRHGDGSVALYAHLGHGGVAVAPGEDVAAGRLLGYSGATGEASEPHLHFVVLRTERNATGWPEEVSIPVKFYIGAPAVEFAPRAAVRVTAEYSHPVQIPRAATEGAPLAPWKLPALAAGEEGAAWRLLALWLACGVAALAWFWLFSRE